MPIDAAGVRSIRALQRALKRMPITTSARIAARYAPVATQLAQDAHGYGRTVYGTPRPRGVDGQALTLERTGAAKRALQFVATGRDVRIPVMPRYVKYLIGTYRILPNGPLPAEWRERITRIAAEVLYAELHGGAP
jgi:hypothetical protein